MGPHMKFLAWKKFSLCKMIFCKAKKFANGSQYLISSAHARQCEMFLSFGKFGP